MGTSLAESHIASPRTKHELPHRADQRIRRDRGNRRSTTHDGQVIEPVAKLDFVLGYVNTRTTAQPAGGGDLMIVAGLLHRGSPRHHQHRLRELKRGQDRAHAGMADYDLARSNPLLELVRIDSLGPSNVPRPQRRMTDLRKHLLFGVRGCPRIDCRDKAVEGHLMTDRHEDQRTAPENSGPSGAAR